MERSILFRVLIGLVVALPQALHAQSTNTPALGIQRIASGLKLPVFATAPQGDTNRLFVVEQHTGRIMIVNLDTKTVAAQPFLTVTGVSQGEEQGLLGLAFHPGYLTNGFFYVNYTTAGGGAAGHSEVTRFQASGPPSTTGLADPLTKTVLLPYDQPEVNHNAGWLAFGPDGYLYVATGDGGGGDDRHGTFGNAQNRNVLLGKILRLDVDHGTLYAIPDGNPFKGVAGEREEIWAFGVRNPWRCSFDRLTGDLWIGDVGQNTREEIDFAPAGVGGLNFGWRPREGLIQNPTYPNEKPVTTATDPVHDYTHSSGNNAVIGGYVYRGQAIPALQGTYFFGDNGSGRLWSFRSNGTNKLEFQDRTAQLYPGKKITVSSFGEDASGELYVCSLGSGEIYKIVPPALKLLSPTVSGGSLTFGFTAQPGQAYVVEKTLQLGTNAWQVVTNFNVQASTTNSLVTDSLSSTQSFYRVHSP